MADRSPFIWTRHNLSFGRTLSFHSAEGVAYNWPNVRGARLSSFRGAAAAGGARRHPVVLIHGPRQCGKTTLAQRVGASSGYTYLTFDDDVELEAARTDPVGYVADLPRKVILDEVQRAPFLFRTLKAAVDRDRQPGRFILTGSSNVLLVPRLSDSLAGRMEIRRLYPLAQCELVGRPSGFLDALFGRTFRQTRVERLGGELAELMVAGGYPAALARARGARRVMWYENYISTLVHRDVPDLSRVNALDALPKLLRLAAGQTARLVNVAELAAPFQLTRPTIRDYLTLLERVFLVETLQPWHSNRLSRLIKTPKLHVGDTGLAAALLGLSVSALHGDRGLFGQFVETFVYQELLRQASWHEATISFYHYRDKDGAEVDVVLERDDELAGVEVKASATVTASDFRGLHKLAAASGKRFAAGIVLYDGERTLGFGERLHAVPIRMLWETR